MSMTNHTVGQEHENRKMDIDMWKVRNDYYKHLSTVSGATVVAVAAVIGALFEKPPPALVVAALALLLIAVVGSLVASHEAMQVARRITKEGRMNNEKEKAENKRKKDKNTDVYTVRRRLAVSTYVLGLLTFLLLIGTKVLP